MKTIYVMFGLLSREEDILNDYLFKDITYVRTKKVELTGNSRICKRASNYSLSFKIWGIQTWSTTYLTSLNIFYFKYPTPGYYSGQSDTCLNADHENTTSVTFGACVPSSFREREKWLVCLNMLYFHNLQKLPRCENGKNPGMYI